MIFSWILFYLSSFSSLVVLLYPFSPLWSTLKALKGKLKPFITFNAFVLPLWAYSPSAGVKTVRLVFGPSPALVSALTYTSYVANGTRLLNTNLWSFVLLSRTWPGIKARDFRSKTETVHGYFPVWWTNERTNLFGEKVTGNQLQWNNAEYMGNETTNQPTKQATARRCEF